MMSADRGIVLQQIDRLYREGTLSGLGDSQLLERYLTRQDETAFRALVDQHGPMVLGLCRRVLRDPRDVEDAFQATFLVLVRKAAAIRDRELLSNWLYGVAYRVARRVRTRTLRRHEREITVDKLEVAGASHPADIDGVGALLDQELNRLPAKYRAPLLLCYFQGQTHDQAAVELGCPVGTVRSRLSRGRDLLKRRLIRRGCSPTAGILGRGWDLLSRPGIEAVPPHLISSTVAAALAIDASKTIPACAAAASVFALSQGVLTTMKLSQLRCAGFAILATVLSAGGVIAVAYAAADIPIQAETSAGVRVSVGDPEAQVIPRPTDEKEPNQNESPGSTEPLRSSPGLPKSDANFSQPADLSNRSIRELEVELTLALNDEKRAEVLSESASISEEQRQKAQGKVALIKAELVGLDEDLADEIERLKLQLTRKDAELDRAMAQRNVVAIAIARNKRLNERKPGMISDDDVAKTEAEYAVTAAQFAIVQAEKAEVEMRIQQLQKRAGRIKATIKLARPDRELKR